MLYNLISMMSFSFPQRVYFCVYPSFAYPEFYVDFYFSLVLDGFNCNLMMILSLSHVCVSSLVSLL
jgi:hypothetical protein